MIDNQNILRADIETLGQPGQWSLRPWTSSSSHLVSLMCASVHIHMYTTSDRKCKHSVNEHTRYVCISLPVYDVCIYAYMFLLLAFWLWLWLLFFLVVFFPCFLCSDLFVCYGASTSRHASCSHLGASCLCSNPESAGKDMYAMHTRWRLFACVYLCGAFSKHGIPKMAGLIL